METPGFFQQFFGIMGPWKVPMIILFFFVIALILFKVYDIYINPKADTSTKRRWLNAILFWGSINLALGILAQLTGMWQVFKIIETVPDISPVMVISGFIGSFSSVIFGLVTLVIAAVSWFGLKSKI
jgi:hypothetical protein